MRPSNSTTATTCTQWLLCTLLLLPFSLSATEYQLHIKAHRFIPSVLEVAANEKIRIIVQNDDATPEEFESYELNREKVVAGNSRITIFLPALDAGTYPFFGEFHEATAQGKIVTK